MKAEMPIAEMPEARFYGKFAMGAVVCHLCPQYCHIAAGGRGICGGRQNSGGRLVAAHYGLVSSVALDPIEKKPLRRFRPGTNILSIGGFGCNLSCPFCQNHQISLTYDIGRGDFLTAADVAAMARRTVTQGNIGIAYTYNEPLIGYEFVADCAKLVHGDGLANILVTNGFINPAPLKELLPLIDAMNIDLKSFRQEFYQGVGGQLEAVQETIRTAVRACHVEVTTLVIPGENEDDIVSVAAWLSALDADIPLHLTRFHPRHHYRDRAAATEETVGRLRRVAGEYLRYVY